VLLMLLPMVQRPVAPMPPAAPLVAMPTAQPAVAVAVTGRRPGGGPYGITPERRALLNTIRFAEGTWIGGSQEGYQVLYGGDRFEDLSRRRGLSVPPHHLGPGR
jgi:muramidase (phage lysozyme)